MKALVWHGKRDVIVDTVRHPRSRTHGHCCRVGSEVGDLHVGDRVVVPFNLAFRTSRVRFGAPGFGGLGVEAGWEVEQVSRLARSASNSRDNACPTRSLSRPTSSRDSPSTAGSYGVAHSPSAYIGRRPATRLRTTTPNAAAGGEFEAVDEDVDDR